MASDENDKIVRLPGAGQRPPPGPGDGGEGLEARVAKLEATVQHIQSDVSDIKTDLRELRNQARNDFRLLFTAIIVATLGLAGLMARGFGWL